jgi:hypothetical protein
LLPIAGIIIRDEQLFMKTLLLASIILKQLLLILLQLVIIAISVLYSYKIYARIAPDKQAKESFSQTYCTILKRKISYADNLFNRYRADFVVKYNVTGREFISLATGSGVMQQYVTDYQQQANILQQFIVGNSYVCWYDPHYPQVVVLLLQHNFLSTLPILFPTIVGLIAFGYLLIALADFYHSCCSLIIRRTVARRRVFSWHKKNFTHL